MNPHPAVVNRLTGTAQCPACRHRFRSRSIKVDALGWRIVRAITAFPFVTDTARIVNRNVCRKADGLGACPGGLGRVGVRNRANDCIGHGDFNLRGHGFRATVGSHGVNGRRCGQN